MKYLILNITLLLSFSAFSQSLTILLKDEHTDQAIEGAHISWVTGTDSVFSVTDVHGKAILLKGNSQLKITAEHISYLTKTVSIKPSVLNTTIYLTPAQDELDEVVVTGQARPVLASQSVRQVRVIGPKRIEQQAAVNLKDLLINDLNILISEDAILGSKINLQGLSGSKVKILIDGVPVIGRLDGNIDLSQINLNDIERVEIVEGPMAVQYGTDAMAGTINLITKRKALSKPEGIINGYCETVGRYNFDGTVNFPVGKTHGNISVGRNFFDGYDPSSDVRNLQWNPKEQYFLSAGAQRRFDKLLLRYRSDLFDEEITNLGEPGSMAPVSEPVDSGSWVYPRALDDYYYTLRLNNSLYSDYYLKSSMKIKAFVAYNHYRRIKKTLMKNLTTGEERKFAGTDAQDTTVFGMWSSRMFFQHDWFPDKFSYQSGYDFSYEENLGGRIEGGFQTITDLALFATAEYQPIEKLNIQPGLRYAYNSRFDAPLISSLALRYQIAENWIFRASYGEGFRAPALKELYFLFVDQNHTILGNKDLQAESSDNFQALISYAEVFENSTLEADLRGFFNNVHNEIRLVEVVAPNETMVNGLYRNENVARTQTTGGTFSAKFTHGGFETETGISLIGIKNDLAFSDAAANKGSDGFNFYSQLKLNLNYEFKRMGLTPAFFINHTGNRIDLVTDQLGNLTSRNFEAYTIADFTLQKKFWKKHLNISLGVKNIFNVTSIESSTNEGGGVHSSGSTPLSYGRSFFTRLQIHLP